MRGGRKSWEAKGKVVMCVLGKGLDTAAKDPDEGGGGKKF